MKLKRKKKNVKYIIIIGPVENTDMSLYFELYMRDNK